MRIAVWHNLPSGGGKRALYNQLRGLSARGHSIMAWCPSTADSDYLPIRSLSIPEERIPLDVLERKGPLQVLSRYARADSEALDRIRAMNAHAITFAEIVNGGDFDLVFASSCRWFYTPFVARHLRIPSVLYLQEPCRKLYEARPTLPWVAEPDVIEPWWHPRAIQHWLGSAARVDAVRVQAREEYTSIRAFTRVLVNSRFSRESVLKAFDVDAQVCYLGVDTSIFSPAGAKDDFVLSVGEFKPHKNPSFLIRAIASSRQRPTLLWVANQVDERCLHDVAELSLKLGVTLELKRRVSEKELVEFYRRASLFLYAPRLEPFGLAALEASSCGTPVIAVAEGGVRETIAHMETGMVVESDPQAMAAAIDMLLEDPARAKELGENGTRQVRLKWSDEAAVDRIERALEGVLATPTVG